MYLLNGIQAVQCKNRYFLVKQLHESYGASGGGTTPLIVKTIRKKAAEAINMILFKCYQNRLGQHL